MVLTAEVELEWPSEHINIEPPLSEICTVEDVDHVALNTILHDLYIRAMKCLLQIIYAT